MQFAGLIIRLILLAGQFIVMVWCQPVYAYLVPAPDIIRETAKAQEEQPRSVWVPYAFWTENLGIAVGAALASRGWPEEQVGTFSTVLGTSNASFIGFGYAGNIQVPFGNRLFMDGTVIVGRFTKLHAYISGSPDFSYERAGSHESSPDNSIIEEGWDNTLELRFKYILPIGHGRDHIINIYSVENGFLVGGAGGGWSWNPLASGRSWIDIKPFYRLLAFDFEGENPPGSSAGIELALACDNTDYFHNPTRGYMARVAYTRDPGISDSNNSWTYLEGEFSTYFGLPPTNMVEQQVLAFNVWTGDSPTTRTVDTPEKTIISGNPPYYNGAFLGGFRRLRGYPQYRFHDRSGIYYGLEYRIIPEWQPLKRIFNRYQFTREFEMKWWQFVAFGEIARVAPSWSLAELHRDMKWSLGIGLRGMFLNTLLRLDMAGSREGVAMWVMVGHPF